MTEIIIHTSYSEPPVIEAESGSSCHWLSVKIYGVEITIFADQHQVDILADAFRRAFPDPTIAALDPAGDHFHHCDIGVAKNTSNA
jgi:hypothetical protein